MIDRRLLIAAAVSLGAHLLFRKAVAQLPPLQQHAPIERVAVRLVEPPPPPVPDEPPPEPPKPPEPEPPQPRPPITPPKVAKVVPQRAATTTPTVNDQAPPDTPPSEHAVVEPGATGAPVFGVTMQSTSSAGAGPAMPVGNTGDPTAGRAPAATVRPQAPAVAAVEVTKMPIPQGRCAGKYTDAARAAGVEGTVVLDLIVDERGRARDIRVVTPLDHGLTEAAVAAVTACQFSPGEKGGQPVPVKVRGFKIRFVLADAS